MSVGTMSVAIGVATVARLWLISCLFVDNALSQLTSTGQTVTVGKIPYYVPAKPVTTVALWGYHGTQSCGELQPVTVLGSSENIQTTVDGFAKADDVWNYGFARIVLIASKASYRGANQTAITGLGGYNSTTVLPATSTADIPPGPYLLSSTGALYQPWRLYVDFGGAFTQPLIPTSDGAFAALPAAVPSIASVAVAVPSRLYFIKTAAKPLAGVRIGIKDIYDVAGVRKSNGNRAYYALYPPATATAPSVQRLVNAGAILVGKMKTSQFANGELPTADWVDYHAPFNPRGDGYQDPSSSSSGAGSGEGSYPWLDLALGSDTGGSVRGPAQVQGLFGNRPTRGLTSSNGVMPLAPELDTAGFEARDPALWMAAAEVLYPSLKPYPTYPRKLYTVDFPSDASTESDAILLDFLPKLEALLGVTAEKLDYQALWNETKPAEAGPASLDVFLNLTYPVLISKEQTKLLRDSFYADYAAKYDGRRPFVDPAPLVRWAFADSLPDSALTEAQFNKTVFMEWWNTNILPPTAETCSESFIIYSVGQVIQYRNVYKDPPVPPAGFDTTYVSPFSEVPDFVFPLGQASYDSTITNHTEELPVTVNVMAARNCDLQIYKLASELTNAGILKIPNAGRTVLDGGEVLMRRDF